MLAGIIVTHAGLAAAMRDAAARIAGDGAGDLETVSNDGCNTDDIQARIAAALDRVRADGTILFVDTVGGSCAAAGLLALGARPDVRLVTGVNLAMLVDFALRRADLDLDAMVERLVKRGQASIRELRRP